MLNHTILVPIDGSELSERALPYARAFARGHHGSLILLQVVSPRGRDGNRSDAIEAARLAALGYLDQLAGRWGSEAAVETVARVGDPADEILKLIDEKSVNLVVMSTHGRSGVGRWIYGSVADHVLRQSSVPVLLIPSACRRSWSADSVHRVLVPLDGSATAEAALEPARDLARSLSAELVLIRAVEPHPMAYTDPTAAILTDPTPELDAARDYLAHLAKKIQAEGTHVSYGEEFGFALTTILDSASTLDVDAIAIATHGRGGVARLMMGSVATGIIQYAGRPIFIVRPKPARADAARVGYGSGARPAPVG